ncbi:hypothetical protein LCGC14_1113120 [marine sediment metagenome]|uniref:Uncharacterized protein n=1 Tax=marine sediment metagenome TaxID=412755 RepID=A0A0F9PPA3_9ZZZZ
MTNKVGTHYNSLIDALQAMSKVHAELIKARNAIDEESNDTNDLALRSKLCGMVEDVYGLKSETRELIDYALDLL